MSSPRERARIEPGKVREHLRIDAGDQIDFVVTDRDGLGLRAAYRLGKATIADALDKVLSTAVFSFDDRELLGAAVHDYREGAADFADSVIGRRNVHSGCEHTVTFDRSLREDSSFLMLCRVDLITSTVLEEEMVGWEQDTLRFAVMLLRCAVLLLFTACATTSPAPVTVPDQYSAIPLYEKGGPISAPQVVQRVQPTPSPEFRASRSSAAATVEAVVGTNGNVLDAWYASGDPQWAEFLVKAVRNWKFTPATLDGQPVTVRVKVSSTFRH